MASKSELWKKGITSKIEITDITTQLIDKITFRNIRLK